MEGAGTERTLATRAPGAPRPPARPGGQKRETGREGRRMSSFDPGSKDSQTRVSTMKGDLGL